MIRNQINKRSTNNSVLICFFLLCQFFICVCVRVSLVLFDAGQQRLQPPGGALAVSVQEGDDLHKAQNMLGPLSRDGVECTWSMWGALHTWPVESDAPFRRARMSPERCSILTTLTGISNLLTYCSSGRFRKSAPGEGGGGGEEERHFEVEDKKV